MKNVLSKERSSQKKDKSGHSQNLTISGHTFYIFSYKAKNLLHVFLFEHLRNISRNNPKRNGKINNDEIKAMISPRYQPF